jgi:hypothetical protein
LREIGILLLVFVPLDATFYQGEIRWPASFSKGDSTVGMVIPFLAFGLAVAGLMVAGFRSKRAFLARAIVRSADGDSEQRRHRLASTLRRFAFRVAPSAKTEVRFCLPI